MVTKPDTNKEQTMLDIKALDVQIHEKTILKNLTLQVQKGEIHAIMGT